MKFSHCDETWLKYKTKDDLLGHLKSDGVHISVVKGKRVVYLHDISHKKSDLCNKNNK